MQSTTVTRIAAWALILGLTPWASNAADLDKLRVGAGTITGSVARLNGFYAKWGLDIQKVPSTPSDIMRRYLADGTVDLVDDGLDNAVASTLEGVDIVIVMGSSLSDQELIGQPGLKSAKDLRGKTVLVDAPDTQYALLLKKILLQDGLKPNVDYELKSGITQRFPEMQAHKEYAAGMMSGTTAFYAKSLGFVSLGSSGKSIGPILASGAYVRRQWAHEHADLLSRFIAANIEAQRWMLDKGNEEKVVQILVDTSDPKVPREIAAQAYRQMMTGPGALTKELGFDVSAFKTFLKVRAQVQGSWGGSPPPATNFYDLTFYQRARELVNKKN